jgi:RNA polymerase sigma-70 factor (ECF subfamily)
VPDPSGLSQRIEVWIARLNAGDEAARKELLNCACVRLDRLAHKMLRGFPRVQRWEQTSDVRQNAAMRLYRALENVRPATVQDFFRLAALNIRRELLDLAKHYYGPRGRGAKHASVAGQEQGERNPGNPLEPPALDEEPSRLAAWTEFHRHIDALPDEERALFDLLWYQGLSQAEAGEILAVSERTIKRRWRSARLNLHDALHGHMPEM